MILVRLALQLFMSFMQNQNGRLISLSRLRSNDLVSAGLILVLLSLTLHLSGLLSRVDDLIYDLGQRLVVSNPPDDVIIIAIDQESLLQLGRWPWSREVHAQLLEQLKPEQPAVIGFDIIFAEPEQSNPQADQRFAKAMADANNVVLPVLLESVRANGQIIETLPLPLFMQSSADVGRVHAVLDADSIARAVYLYEGVGAPVWQLFSQAILNIAKRQPSKNNFESNNAKSGSAYTLIQKDKRRVDFTGPPGHYNHISYAQVLKGEFLPETFKNKIVLVGATALGMNDLLTTPVSGLSTPMTGVEFHANVFNSLRNNTLINTTPLWLSSMVILTISLMPLLWMPKISALRGFVFSILFMILVAIAASFLPRMANIWLPPAAALLAVLLAYPIWSWRKLEAAQRYLDYELDYLKKNMAQSHSSVYEPASAGYDAFDARIAQVRNASKQLRYLNNSRKETLAFISHDLRAPLANAIAVIDKYDEVKVLLHKPLSQALGLAEDFLHVSRAEMIDVNAFDEIDFVGLVHQAVDDAYNEATEKRINLIRDIPDNLVWVEGNFGLLHRAILNLILNAIKYSPEKTEIIVKVSVVEQSSIIVSITDQGPGISNKDQVNLFKRFSRVKGHEKTASGTGLGLYFVNVVVEKHSGRIQVKSDIGSGTTFSISLPTVGVA